MRLQTDDAINDVRARFLEPAGPLDIGGFVETRAQFHQRRDLLARTGRVHERFHDGRVAARPI